SPRRTLPTDCRPFVRVCPDGRPRVRGGGLRRLSRARAPRGCSKATLGLVASAGFQSDRATDARATETAIAVRVLPQVLLVVLLGVVEWRRFREFCRDLAVPRRAQHLLVATAGGLGELSLRVTVPVDRRTILGPDVVPLSHALRRIVVFPEHL